MESTMLVRCIRVQRNLLTVELHLLSWQFSFMSMSLRLSECLSVCLCVYLSIYRCFYFRVYFKLCVTYKLVVPKCKASDQKDCKDDDNSAKMAAIKYRQSSS